MFKPPLMIHRVPADIFKHPLEKFILTFDDGYDDHYTSFSKFLEIPTQKIYFITCSWIGRSGFLTVEQIKYMNSFDNVTIGAHSFAHQNLRLLTLEETIKFVEEDTAKTCEWFEKMLGFIPTTFCYPFNNPAYGSYTEVLQKYGFTEFYGGERIDVEWLENPEWTKNNRLW